MTNDGGTRKPDDLDPSREQGVEVERPSDPSSDAVVGLLKKALGDAPRPERSFLPSIQQRIRITTRGRYFRDRWSTQTNNVPLLLMAALLIVILAATVFMVLQPLVDAPEETHLPAPPADILGPNKDPGK